MLPDPRDLPAGQLLKEAIDNAREIVRLSESVKGLSTWDKWMIGLNIGAAAAGIALTPFTLGWSLVVTVISTVLLAADIAKKTLDLRVVNAEIRARMALLEERNRVLLAEIRRRFSRR